MNNDHSEISERLNTFKNFPNPNFDFNNLAILGFYFTNRGLETKCYYCNIIINDWTVEETRCLSTALQKHFKKSPHCECAIKLNLSFNIENLHENTTSLNIDVEEVLLKYDLSIELNRLKTFFNWPSTNIHSPIDMAKYGFVFIGPNDSDRVQCVYCLVILKSWDPEDNVGREHMKHSRSCPMVTNNFNEQIVLMHHKPKMGKHVFQSVAEVFGVTNQPMLETISSDDIPYTTSKPQKGSMSMLVRRLETFTNWSPALKQKPRDLAEAGFFFLEGTYDRVQCFWCGLNLFHWKPEDDPLNEHQKHYQDCKYLQDRLRERLEKEMHNVSLNSEVMAIQETDNVPQSMQDMDQDDGLDLCKICFSKKRNTLFLPCRHIVACDMCSINIISEENSSCPLCRTTIKGTVEVFL